MTKYITVLLSLVASSAVFAQSQQAIRDQIDAAYALPMPKITISHFLTEICKRFTPDSEYVGPVVDDIFFCDPDEADARKSNEPLRVLLVGPMQADFKGLDVGYAAVERARSLGAEFDLVRVSQWPAANDEPVAQANEFHIGLKSPDMARLYRSCDIFLGPSRHQEGFGLPAAESMASGIVAVLSAIPSFSSFDEMHDYALFSPEDDAAAMTENLLLALSDKALRHRVARRGRQIVEQYRAARTAERMENYFLRRLTR